MIQSSKSSFFLPELDKMKEVLAEITTILKTWIATQENCLILARLSTLPTYEAKPTYPWSETLPTYDPKPYLLMMPILQTHDAKPTHDANYTYDASLTSDDNRGWCKTY